MTLSADDLRFLRFGHRFDGARGGELLNRLGRLGPRFTDALVASAADKTYYDGTLVCRVTGLQYTPLDETLRRVVTQYLTDKKRRA